MSFMLTTEQVKNRTKTVTRRNGWWMLKPGDIVNACEKCMGLKKGEKVNKICQIRIISTKAERLGDMAESDLTKEGFPDMTVTEFVDMFMDSHKHTNPFSIINRIQFEYL